MFSYKLIKHWFFVYAFAFVACGSCLEKPYATEKQAPLQAVLQKGDFAVIGDFGESGPAEAAVAALVRDFKPDFIITVGDNNYPNGEESTIEDNIGRYFGDYIVHPNKKTPVGPGNRFFPTLGNHDWHTPTIKPYLDYFDLPGNKRYYQFRRGDVEFFALDSDPHEPDGVKQDSIQGLWLKNALQHSTAPWKVVYMHHPPYSSGRHGSNEWAQWPYKAWGADIVLAGHDHHYERLLFDGLYYIVCGTGGAHLHDVEASSKNEMQQLGAKNHVTYAQKHGAMKVHVTASEMTLQFINIDHDVIDTFSLKK